MDSHKVDFSYFAAQVWTSRINWTPTIAFLAAAQTIFNHFRQKLSSGLKMSSLRHCSAL